jgi:hypothetical protein
MLSSSRLIVHDLSTVYRNVDSFVTFPFIIFIKFLSDDCTIFCFALAHVTAYSLNMKNKINKERRRSMNATPIRLYISMYKDVMYIMLYIHTQFFLPYYIIDMLFVAKCL